MISWLHSFTPSEIIFSIGFLQIRWYGLMLVCGMIIALFLSLKISKYYQIKKELIWDISFWLIVNGLIGARIYEVFLEWPYYLSQPINIFKIWEGGLAIHGGIIAGLITIWHFSKKEKIYFWKLSALFAPGLALAQAVGRFGNYFNQELFGKPTSLPWGIPIDPEKRPLGFENYSFFHPTFLYESIGLIIIFLALIIITIYIIKRQKIKQFSFILLSALYMILYSLLRFSLEFIKIDKTPSFFFLRWPQFISLLFILFSFILLIKNYHVIKKTN